MIECDDEPPRRGYRLAIVVAILGLAIVVGRAMSGGGGRPSSNRSAMSLDDPARAALAQQQARSAERSNRDAEAVFYRRMGTGGPETVRDSPDR